MLSYEDAIPHGMMTQQSPQDVFERWKQTAAEYFNTQREVDIRRTEISLPSTFPAFFIKRGVRISRYSTREFAHIHAPLDLTLGTVMKSALLSRRFDLNSRIPRRYPPGTQRFSFTLAFRWK